MVARYYKVKAHEISEDCWGSQGEEICLEALVRLGWLAVMERYRKVYTVSEDDGKTGGILGGWANGLRKAVLR